MEAIAASGWRPSGVSHPRFKCPVMEKLRGLASKKHPARLISDCPILGIYTGPFIPSFSKGQCSPLRETRFHSRDSPVRLNAPSSSGNSFVALGYHKNARNLKQTSYFQLSLQRIHHSSISLSSHHTPDHLCFCCDQKASAPARGPGAAAGQAW